MGTPADQRLLELLDKWRRSLELHAEYSKLDDDSYWKIQPWVEHQRPTRWIVDVALQKTAALREALEARIEAADATFADSLELMIFLANLVGAQHIERFIPVAESAGAVLGPVAPQERTDSTATDTREMPKLPLPRRASPEAGTRVARIERGAGPKADAGAPPATRTKIGARDQVVADAVRLMQWGRKWFEIAELIARMAGRPPLPEVRRILKENKAAIDAQVAGA